MTAVLWVLGTAFARASDAPFVPGTGHKLADASDDFEDTEWSWTPNLPKSSSNIDGYVQYPLGASSNGKWLESALRGTPDVVKRVQVPEGGLPDSKAALMIRTMKTGGQYGLTYQQQQDDLQLNALNRVGSLSAGQGPSFVVRVYLPPWSKWEQRVGATLGIRADLVTGSFARDPFGDLKSYEGYWPGFFIQFNGKTSSENSKEHDLAEHYSATVLLRSNQNGNDVPAMNITEYGWWTFGLSITGDGRVHYYVRKGVEDLTSKDYVASMTPYGFRCEQCNSFFFNVSNIDDGKTWSTPWIIDDPTIYVRLKEAPYRPQAHRSQPGPGRSFFGRRR